MVQHSERSSSNDSVAAAPRAERSEPNVDRMSDLKSYDSIVNRGSGAGTQLASVDANTGMPPHNNYDFYNSTAFGTAGIGGANGFGVGTDSGVKGANGVGTD